MVSALTVFSGQPYPFIGRIGGLACRRQSSLYCASSAHEKLEGSINAGFGGRQPLIGVRDRVDTSKNY
jgi:hypothetical protein